MSDTIQFILSVLVMWLLYAVMVFVYYLPARIILFILRRKWRFPTSTNFRTETVPTGLGIFFAFNHFLVILLYSANDLLPYFTDAKSVSASSISRAVWYVVSLSSPLWVSAIGYFDDVRGEKTVKGLKNNVKTFLFTGHFTSSLMKLFGIFICAFMWAIGYEHYYFASEHSLLNVIINIFLIALFTNFLNLLDLRPGRAIKASFLLFILFSICQPSTLTLSETKHSSLMMIVPTLAAVLAYAPLDFRGQAMMGDAGSNMLGFVLGIGYAVILPLPAKIAVVILLTLFHIYCEFYSFSDFISRNRVLRWLDEWGTCMRKDSKRENKAGSDPGGV